MDTRSSKINLSFRLIDQSVTRLSPFANTEAFSFSLVVFAARRKEKKEQNAETDSVLNNTKYGCSLWPGDVDRTHSILTLHFGAISTHICLTQSTLCACVFFFLTGSLQTTHFAFQYQFNCYSWDFFPQHFLNSAYKSPVSPCGPMMPMTVTNNPRANRMENPIVQNMNRPNWTKNKIFAARRKIEAPSVVTAPDRTEMPTSRSMSWTRPWRSGRWDRL